MQFALYLFTLALVLVPLSNARITCPPSAPSKESCSRCQRAIDSVFPANYFEPYEVPDLPSYTHPCDFKSAWFYEFLRHWKPNMTAYDPEVMGMIKDAITLNCNKQNTCTENLAIPAAKLIEKDCGELVATAKNTDGILDAIIASIILRTGIPERTVYCAKDKDNGKECSITINHHCT
jgi:hypothetical protein